MSPVPEPPLQDSHSPASGRLIAIGDIHGCSVALHALLEAMKPEPNDIVVTLGDYVDRGPDSSGVVDQLIDLGTRTQLIALKGNHEEMMLEVMNHGKPHHDWFRYGGDTTLASYDYTGCNSCIPDSHQRFFENLGDFFVYDQYFFTHAAYDPNVPLEYQDIGMLRWYSLNDGIPGPHQNGLTAIVGHTANKDGQVANYGHIICIDTYCYNGGYLTGIDLTNRHTFQADQMGQVRF